MVSATTRLGVENETTDQSETPELRREPDHRRQRGQTAAILTQLQNREAASDPDAGSSARSESRGAGPGHETMSVTASP